MAGATTSQVSGVFPQTFQPAVEFVIRWFPLVIVAVLWELSSGWFVAESILPGPIAVFTQWGHMLADGGLLVHLGISLYRVSIGITLSISVGVLLGVSMARSTSVENFFDVFLALLYPVPKTALVPLSLLWLGRGTGTAILIIFLACLLPVILNSYNAARSVDQSLIWSAQMMGTSNRRILWKIIIPDTIPQIVTGIRQAIPIAFIALTGAELIGASDGVGYLILDYGSLGIYPQMFGALLTISLTAFFALRGFDYIERKVFVWT